MEATTRIHTGKTPMPGIASAINPGSSAHRRPRIKNRRKAVPTSSAHCKGGATTVQNANMSDTAATPNARPNLARECRFKGASESTGDNTSIFPVCIGLFSIVGLIGLRARALLGARRNNDHPMTAPEAQPACCLRPEKHGTKTPLQNRP